MSSGNIGFDSVGDSIPTRMGDKLLRPGVGKFRIDNGDIRSDFEVGNRELDTLLVIRNNREGSDFRSCSGRRGNSAEMGFMTELR